MLAGPYYPRSFTILVIVAMGVLIVPLASSLINTVRVLQGVVDTQRAFTRTSLALTRDVREIVESVSQFQRTAGQYHLLRDAEFEPALAAAYQNLRVRFAALDPLLHDPEARATLAALRAHSDEVYATAQPGSFLGADEFHALGARFDMLDAEARALLTRADAEVQLELQSLETTVQETRRRLILLALALIPLTLLLAGVFSWMINRPIKQIKVSIQQLGQADLSPLPRISGPQDIVDLGRDLEWLRQRLQALEEQKLRFLRHVSHELKTPLASLREGVALLGDELAGSLNARQRSIVAIMDAGSRDLQQRIEDLIRYGGLMHDPTLRPPAPQPLEPVVAAVLERHRLALDARAIAIESDLAAPIVYAERTQLETALDNLLSNAVKFSPDGGRVLIRSETTDDGVAVWVCDQGAGISDADRPHVFEPFYQGLHQPATAVKGSGLGLSIVRESLLASGGNVDVVEYAPWSTCFRLTWPNPPQ